MNRNLFTRSGKVEVDPGEIQPYFSEIIFTQYVAVALMTPLIYHSLLTMDKEIKYFWPKPFNHISLLYFVNRCVGILGAICGIIPNGFSESLASCVFSIWAQAVCGLIILVLIDYILVIRVLALYEQNRQLAIILKLLLALEAVSCLGMLVYGIMVQKTTIFVLAQNVTVCGALNAPPITLSISSWAISLTYGLILLALALYKAAEFWRLSFGFRGFFLVKVLIRDQVLYYGFVIFCCALKMAAASVYISSPVVAVIFATASNPTLLCILGSQLLINLKEAGELGVNEGTNYRSTSVSNIDFVEGPGAQAEEVAHELSIAGSGI